jgi:phage/plasmid-like protein (TIGR03299 family)
MSANLQRNTYAKSGYSHVCIGEAWHGQQNPLTGDRDHDRRVAGQDYECHQVNVPEIKVTTPEGIELTIAAPRKVLYHSKTGDFFGVAGLNYKPHQPRELEDFAYDYAGKAGLKLNSFGTLGVGEKLWFSMDMGDHDVAGMRSRRNLLLTTGFDVQTATRIEGANTMVVCQNTFMAAQAEPGQEKRVIRRSHNAAWNAQTVAEDVSILLAAHDRYKQIGDALGVVAFGEDVFVPFAKTLLGIDLKAKPEDVTTRKLNQFDAVIKAWRTSQDERGGSKDAFTAIQAVTRYVDHDRDIRGGRSLPNLMENIIHGTGAKLKSDAMAMLFPLIKDKVAVAA